MTATRLFTGLLLGAVLGLPGTAAAERFEQFGDLQVHYNAVPTATLEPAVARQYNIVRSRNRGLLTVSLLRDGETVPGALQASATTLNDVLRQISMRQIREGDAVYYLGTFPVAHEELLRFEIRGSAQGGDPFTVTFRQRFFTEP